MDKQEAKKLLTKKLAGGAVAMNIDSKETPLILLCPGWKTWGSATTVKPNTTILHAQADDVVPFTHRLADEESLAKMVEAVERARDDA